MGLSNGQNCHNDQGDVVVVVAAVATAAGIALAASHHEVAVVHKYDNGVVDVDDIDDVGVVVDVGAVVVADIDLKILEGLVCHPTTFCHCQNCCCCCCGEG